MLRDQYEVDKFFIEIAQRVTAMDAILMRIDGILEDYEAQPWFRRARRFHVGVEGRISVLKRKHGLNRCRNHGEKGFHRWVGWGVIANNLTQIGRKLASRPC